MVRIDARTYWNWVFQNQQVVIDVIRNSRAASVVADVLDGHRPSGRCDHDCVVLDGVASAEPIKLLVVRSHASLSPARHDGDVFLFGRLFRRRLANLRFRTDAEPLGKVRAQLAAPIGATSCDRRQTEHPLNRRAGSSMDKHRDLGVREHLDRLASEDDRGDAAPAVRGHHNKVATLRLRGIDDRPVGMLILDTDQLARDA